MPQDLFNLGSVKPLTKQAPKPPSLAPSMTGVSTAAPEGLCSSLSFSPISLCESLPVGSYSSSAYGPSRPGTSANAAFMFTGNEQKYFFFVSISVHTWFSLSFLFIKKCCITEWVWGRGWFSCQLSTESGFSHSSYLCLVCSSLAWI